MIAIGEIVTKRKDNIPSELFDFALIIGVNMSYDPYDLLVDLVVELFVAGMKTFASGV